MTAGMRNQSIQRVWGHVREKINLVIFSEKNKLPAFPELEVLKKSKDFTRVVC